MFTLDSTTYTPQRFLAADFAEGPKQRFCIHNAMKKQDRTWLC
jgi:hypothetical protein